MAGPTSWFNVPSVQLEVHAMGERQLPEAARRALAEAEERRARRAAEETPKELGGRAGPDPVRYSDWENKGIASDF